MKNRLVCLAIVALGTGVRAEALGVEHAIRLAREERLSMDPGWLRLLRYRKTGRRWLSEENGPDFFLAARGRRDPAAEMEALIRGLFDPPVKDTETSSPPRCRFPARTAWLEKRLGPLGESAACPRFETWRKRLDARSVTLVFASSYMANPASMYGHTFIRLNRSSGGSGDRLNDYCVNFAAESESTSGLMFAIKGLTGGYRGKFSTLPYYLQVQRYTNVESRDLWEYSLSLSPSETDALVRHLWEMGGARFPYYFLTKNCSYALMPLMETVSPGLRISDAFTVKVIPVDTIRAFLSAPGLVTERRLRPSHARRMLARRDLLSSSERRAAERIGWGAEKKPFSSLVGFPPARRALVLDAALDARRYRYGSSRDSGRGDPDVERGILLERVNIPIPAEDVPEPKILPDNPPESGHPTGRIAIGAGRSAGRGVIDLSLRPALHDFADNPRGYVPNSRLDMFHLILRGREGLRRPYVERLALVDIQSLAPFDPWIRKPSWKAFLGGETAADRPADPENAFAARAGYGHGMAVQAGRPAVLYAMAEGDVGAGPVYEKYFRTGLGGSCGVVVRLGSRIRAWGEISSWRYVWGNVGSVRRVYVGGSVDVSEKSALRVTARRDGDRRETLFSALIYF